MALSQASASLAFSFPSTLSFSLGYASSSGTIRYLTSFRDLLLPDSGAIKLARITSPTSTCRLHVPQLSGSRSTFASGSPLLPLNLRMTTRGGGRSGNRGASVSIRSEQSTEGGNGLDIWLGRGAMVGFAVAITVEIATGKGLLENFGVASPLPTVALAVTALVGVLTAVFIFQSSSKN